MNNPMLGGILSGNESSYITVRNDEATASIAKGGVCVFNMDGTREGHDVVLPSSSTAVLASNYIAGIATKAIAAQQVGQVQVRGVVQTLNVVRMTRAASTDSWASFPAVAVGDQLIINTVANMMSRSGAGAATITPAMCVAMTTLASATTVASTTSVTGLVSSATIKAFLRIF